MPGIIFIVAERASQAGYEALFPKTERVERAMLREIMPSASLPDTDLIILDCENDCQLGIRLIRDLKRSRPDVPIIFITAMSSEEIVTGAYKAGARDYFTKPIDCGELGRTAAALLNYRRAGNAQTPSVIGSGSSEKIREYPLGLQRVIDYLDENLSAELPLDALALLSGMSKYHFCRVFKQYLGMSPMKYRSVLRIEKAKEFLLKPGMTVSIVAYKFGFNDLGTFIRQFRNVTGLTPSSFKKTNCAT